MRADDGRGVRMGREGEDVASTSAADGLSLRMPTRFHPASVKGAAWQVQLLRSLPRTSHPDEERTVTTIDAANATQPQLAAGTFS